MDLDLSDSKDNQIFDNQQLYFVLNDPFLRPNSSTIKTLISNFYPNSHA